MIIAIDGPAGSGKTTTAKAVARALGYNYLDTGAMYRAMTLGMLNAGIPIESGPIQAFTPSLKVDVRYEEGKMAVYLNDELVTEAIRTTEVTENVSAVSAEAVVREKMVSEQRRIASEALAAGSGVVVDGRDIGTVVFPDATVKVFMSASAQVRAERRQKQMAEGGEVVPVAEIMAAIQERDHYDSTRAHSPLRQAEDAVLLETGALTLEEQVAYIVQLAMERKPSSDV